MSRIIIEGGRALRGEIIPQGSKNAALPVILSTVAINGVSEISNVPDIGDVRIAIKLLEQMGADVERREDRLIIDTGHLRYVSPDPSLVKEIRASTYLIGGCLARFGRAEIVEFGGCNFDKRPIDLHIAAAQSLGAEYDGSSLYCDRLKGAVIELAKPSVGATINAAIMALGAEGKTVIKGVAREPHVACLLDFLRSAGAQIIQEKGELHISHGELRGGTCAVIPDAMELATYLLLGPLTGGEVYARKEYFDGLSAPLNVIEDSGIRILQRAGECVLSGEAKRPITVVTAPYPGFPTDLQPQMAPLMAKFYGGEISERVWLGRFGYLDRLAEFGIQYKRQGTRAQILTSLIHCGEAEAPDLRGGAACIMAALAADGTSVISNAEVVFRGYSNMIEKLESLGARIRLE